MAATFALAPRMCRAWLVSIALLLAPLAATAAERVTGAQERAALEFLNAVASGNAQAVAYAIHPAELDALRLRLLELLRREAARGESVLRARLFGPGMPLTEIERLTSINFYAALGARLRLMGRPFRDVSGLGAIPEREDTVHVVVRGRQPEGRGDVRVVDVVTLKAYGKDWKAAIPSEIEAQIEDLLAGRGPAPAPRMTNTGSAPAGNASAGNGAGGPAATAPAGVPMAITELIDAAQKALEEGRCEEYYQRHMSPNFRRVTARRAIDTLIASCKQESGSREMLLSTLRIIRGLTPTFQYEGQRAVYDLTGQGLPYDRFALEQVDKRWYIAE